jgi:hypothetical protein
MIYSIDSNSLIGLKKWYPQDLVPDLWNKIDQMLDNGTLVICELVYDELQKKDDELSQWLSLRESKLVLLETNEQFQVVGADIINSYSIVDVNKSKSDADPFVIAFAKVLKGKVVSEENRVSSGGKAINIPNVCEKEGIPCLRLVDFFRETGIKFQVI